jgi:glycosyltransferase involved in cell wall biosynthesis
MFPQIFLESKSYEPLFLISEVLNGSFGESWRKLVVRIFSCESCWSGTTFRCSPMPIILVVRLRSKQLVGYLIFSMSTCRSFLPKSEFMGICAGSDKVIVSSDCARADLRAFSPTHAHKAELLHFVASPVPLAHAATLPELQQLYSFEGPYFLLPNQFWAHKNHRVVLDALQILKQRNQPFLVLATGSPQDYRNPSFYPSLVRHATNIDVLDCFRILGQIPFDHLAGLMRHAVAFINPSRFEGWSTSVEEAKSMGKQVVLSDIPVHREQAPERGFFFADNVPEALADAMQAAFNGFDIQQDAVMQDEANARFLERQQEFAKAYCDIMKRLS